MYVDVNSYLVLVTKRLEELEKRLEKMSQGIIIKSFYTDLKIIESTIHICKLHDIKTAVILSGIGQLSKTQLGYFKEKGNYSPEKLNKPLEILSLTGNICNQEGEYILHLHAVLSDEKKNAIGGHFIDGTVSITAEIVILKTNLEAQRITNKETGLKDLVLE